MKRIFGLLLLLIAFNASAIEINSKLSGIWSNPNQSGHGLNVVTFDENTTIVYWYTYHTDGTPMFLITVGQNNGNRTTGTTYYNTGMVFGDFNPNDIQESVWGTSTVTFNDCNSASLSYSSNEPGYGNGTIPMQRLASVTGLKCSDSPLHGTYMAVLEEPINGYPDTGYGIATLFANGDMVFFAANESRAGVGMGQWRVTTNDGFAFDVTTYSVDGGWNDVSGSGKFNEDALIAAYTGNGKLIATTIPSFQHSLDTAKMAGTYAIHDNNDTIIGSATIQSDGKVTGSTNLGCNFDGWFWVPDTNFNQAYLDVSVSSCGSTERIVGAAVYNNESNQISVMGADGWYGYVWTLK